MRRPGAAERFGMKILQINTVYGEGSTGGIVRDLHDLCADRGIACVSAYRGRAKGRTAPEDTVAVSSVWDGRIHGQWSRFTMFKGTGSLLKTARFLRWVDGYAPDVIHLHNLHGSYINLPLLFEYIKKRGIPVVWTLHDCWAFTAICPHFAMIGCEKWKSGCRDCPQKKRFSSAPVDLSGPVWRAKKAWFTGVPQLTVVTPSRWLGRLAGESFLGAYPRETIPNGVDLDIFTGTESDFRARYALEGKKLVLGVAFAWTDAKGLDVFQALARRLPEDYRIVLVGTDDRVDRTLPPRILSIHKTADRRQLAEIYSAADVFVNPTREEVLGLVNIEALACSTPVITFDSGGSPECVAPDCGAVVPAGDIDAMEREILRVCRQRPYSGASCRARAQQFEKTRCLREYLRLYRDASAGRMNGSP